MNYPRFCLCLRVNYNDVIKLVRSLLGNKTKQLFHYVESFYRTNSCRAINSHLPVLQVGTGTFAPLRDSKTLPL